MTKTQKIHYLAMLALAVFMANIPAKADDRTGIGTGTKIEFTAEIELYNLNNGYAMTILSGAQYLGTQCYLVVHAKESTVAVIPEGRKFYVKVNENKLDLYSGPSYLFSRLAGYIKCIHGRFYTPDQSQIYPSEMRLEMLADVARMKVIEWVDGGIPRKNIHFQPDENAVPTPSSQSGI